MRDEQELIEILQERRVYESEFGCLYDDQVRFALSGHQGTYLRWSWAAPYSIAILPLVPNGFVLLRNYRHSARRLILEVPKGFGSAGVPPEATALRELEEETGLSAASVKHCGAVTTDPAFAHHSMHMFIGLGCTPGVSRPEVTEAIGSAETFGISELDALLSSESVVTDAVTRLLLHEVRSV